MKSAPTPLVSVPRHGVARVLSKMGVASRTEAARWVRDGRVAVNGRIVRDPEFAVRQGVDRIDIDGRAEAPAPRLVVMLNKPRGLVTTARDERGRDTVYRCFADAPLPWIAPIGRLDKASEGLLLFSNDPLWASRLSDASLGILKTYHVQVHAHPSDGVLGRLPSGVTLEGEHLTVVSTRILRSGTRHAWLEIVLDQGRNRQIRRMLAAFDLQVLRLVRVAIGGLQLGELPKGQWRALTAAEIDSL